jgi:ABC-type transport system involved in cytochrome bd biosynthesis fused ATPase/permease subunit
LIKQPFRKTSDNGADAAVASRPKRDEAPCRKVAPGETTCDKGVNLATNAFIRLEGLSKSFQEGDCLRVVLSGAHAAFAPGEFVAILGKSGSGKSTLLNLISGIDRADSGAVWLDNQDLTALDERQRTLFRRRISSTQYRLYLSVLQPDPNADRVGKRDPTP